jgi:hypothetical protein
MKIKLLNVRLAFPVLWTAKAFGGEGKADFGASMLIDPADPQVKTINAAIDATAKEKWGAKAPEILKTLRATDKVCLHNGDSKASYEGFPGNLFVSARNAARPTVVGPDKSPLVEADGKPYAGCYVHAVLELWAQDNKFGKRVNATLMGVQFYADGDSFTGGGVASEDDFDDVTEGATADDLT